MVDRIVFFDINGTLIEKDERTDLPYFDAIDILLDVKGGMDGVNNSARSDQDVFIEVLGKYGIKYSSGIWSDFLGVYQKQLDRYSESDIWRPNVDSSWFLEYLHSLGLPMALITGELSIGAKYKLEKTGIWKFFPTGGFGEDGLKRFDIASTALNKAESFWNCKFKRKTVIGDTVLDIHTAKHIGADIVSIATGSSTEKDLAFEKPDIIIKEFKEAKHLF